jgi:amino acid transporter/mannitol/fructose-specific phosphotransferase system IIA component (Ntr-type)
MKKLSKQLNIVHVFCIASGAMISSGLFVLPGLAHARCGPAVVFSYFLAGLLATAGLLSIAELTTAMPRTGGDYFYISRGLGPGAGTVAGLLSWFSLALKSSFALIGMAVLASTFIDIHPNIISTVLGVVFILINLRGTKEAAGFQVALVSALILIMLAFIGFGFGRIDIARFEPFAPHGLKSVLSTTGFVFVSYGGLIQVASIAGEIKNPGKTIPRGMIVAIIVMVILYTLMIFVTSGVLDSAALNNSLTPISDAAETFWPGAGFVIVSAAAFLAFITTANAGIMTASRYLLALGEDELLPDAVAKVNKSRTPVNAVLVTGAVIIVSVFVNLDILVKAASTVFVLGYVLAGVSVIILRQSGVQNYRPVFRAPFYPWLQLATVIGFAFILLEMGEDAFAVTVLIITAGFAIYWFYGRKRTQNESALLHLIERITAKELVTGTLETELKQIIRERDDIVKDRIDHLVEDSLAVDIDGPIQLENFFQAIADKLHNRLEMEPDLLSRLLIEREKQGSTVLSPSLAIPHIVIPGTDKFQMVIARCKNGVEFSDDARQVKMIFVLAGTQDLRNFYLRVLAAVAHIVQTPEFENMWLNARNPQALKDTVLLAQRKRTHQL